MVKGLSFKKDKRETGLRGISSGDPSTQIKFNKKQVGMISSPNRWTNEQNWRVKLCNQGVRVARGRRETEQLNWVIYFIKNGTRFYITLPVGSVTTKLQLAARFTQVGAEKFLDDYASRQTNMIMEELVG